jgi:hypothetical protein
MNLFVLCYVYERLSVCVHCIAEKMSLAFFGASTGSLSMFNYIMLSIYRPPSRTIRRRDGLELPIGQATTIDD